MAKEEKQSKYRAKSSITLGIPGESGEVETVVYEAGDEVPLTEQQAWDARHALQNPPKKAPTVAKATGEEKEPSEEEQQALESIRRRPDNMESGVMLHWKTDVVAQAAAEQGLRQNKTLETGGGFERLNEGSGINEPLGLNAPFRRPEANKTEMEREDEERNAQAAKRSKQPPAASTKEPPKQGQAASS